MNFLHPQQGDCGGGREGSTGTPDLTWWRRIVCKIARSEQEAHLEQEEQEDQEQEQEQEEKRRRKVYSKLTQ